MRPPLSILSQSCLAILMGLVVQEAPSVFGQTRPDTITPVTDLELQNPNPDDWLMWRRTLDSWGYSPLDQVNRENVGELRMVWTRDLEQRTGEITPLAYGGVLYVPQASDVIQALDAATGDFVWEYSRSIPQDLYTMVGGNARNNRNIAIYDNLIIDTSMDAHVFALLATTGDVVWDTQVFDHTVLSLCIQKLDQIVGILFLSYLSSPGPLIR